MPFPNHLVALVYEDELDDALEQGFPNGLDLVYCIPPSALFAASLMQVRNDGDELQFFQGCYKVMVRDLDTSELSQTRKIPYEEFTYRLPVARSQISGHQHMEFGT